MDITSAARILGQRGGLANTPAQQTQRQTLHITSPHTGRPRKNGPWVWWAHEMTTGQCSSRREACRRLAKAIGRPSLRGLLTATGSDSETYYYATADAREADDTGAYAWAVYPARDPVD